MFHRRTASEQKLHIPFHKRTPSRTTLEKPGSLKLDVRRLVNNRGVWIVLLLLFAIFQLRGDYSPSQLYWEATQLKGNRYWDQWPVEPGWKWNHTTDANNLLLTQNHCQQSFPRLFRELDHQVRSHKSAKSKIQARDLDKLWNADGVVRAMIYNGQLYIINAGHFVDDRSIAVLSQIYRALLTSPEVVEDIEFVFSVDDQQPASTPQWVFARGPRESKTWLMPESGFFSRPESGVGSFHDARRVAENVDLAVPWNQKASKLFWRGAKTGLSQPEALINVTTNQRWADVMPVTLNARDGSVQDGLSMDEHCKAKYLAHTEDTTYSGRLKYLQLCNSVIISHPSRYTTHLSHLLKNDGADQNYLEVREDWSDLESKVRHLQQWDTLGERIAKNNVLTFRQRYLTPAAEVCYWRRLFRGWSRVVAFHPQLYTTDENGITRDRGVSFESFLLQRRSEWDS